MKKEDARIQNTTVEFKTALTSVRGVLDEVERGIVT